MKNKQKIETCKALEMLENSTVIEIANALIHNWHLDTLDCDDDDNVFECNYSDEEGYIYEFFFSKKALTKAVIDGHSITIKDDTGENITVSCYNLTPVTV